MATYLWAVIYVAVIHLCISNCTVFNCGACNGMTMICRDTEICLFECGDCNNAFIYCTNAATECKVRCLNLDSCQYLQVYSAAPITFFECAHDYACKRSRLFCGDIHSYLPISESESLSEWDSSPSSTCFHECRGREVCKDATAICEGDMASCGTKQTNTDSAANYTLQCNAPNADCSIECAGELSCPATTTLDCNQFNTCECTSWCADMVKLPSMSPTKLPTNAPTAPTESPTNIPTTDLPTTAQPTTVSPTTSQPTTKAPTTNIPTTGVPTTAAPVTSNPTTTSPTTGSPTTGQPTTKTPTTNSPTTATPTTISPTTAQPTTAQPTTAEPTTNEPSTNGPTLSPITREPTSMSPTEHSMIITAAEPITEPTSTTPYEQPEETDEYRIVINAEDVNKLDADEVTTIVTDTISTDGIRIHAVSTQTLHGSIIIVVSVSPDIDINEKEMEDELEQQLENKYDQDLSVSVESVDALENNEKRKDLLSLLFTNKMLLMMTILIIALIVIIVCCILVAIYLIINSKTVTKTEEKIKRLDSEKKINAAKVEMHALEKVKSTSLTGNSPISARTNNQSIVTPYLPNLHIGENEKGEGEAPDIEEMYAKVVKAQTLGNRNDEANGSYGKHRIMDQEDSDDDIYAPAFNVVVTATQSVNV